MSKALSNTESGLIVAEDGTPRCFWQPSMPDYHDNEWGHPVVNDQRLFEKICLEGFHSGMSWKLIYNKREHFRRAFNDFDFHLVAQFDQQDVERLMQDASIVRNRAKILSTINNAKRAIELVQEAGSLAAWIWQFEPSPQERPETVNLAYWHENTTSAASRHVQSPEKARLDLCRANHYLFINAGTGAGERSSRRLYLSSGSGGAASKAETAGLKRRGNRGLKRNIMARTTENSLLCAPVGISPFRPEDA